MQGDYEKLKKEENEKSNKLQELMSVTKNSALPYCNNYNKEIQKSPLKTKPILSADDYSNILSSINNSSNNSLTSSPNKKPLAVNNIQKNHKNLLNTLKHSSSFSLIDPSELKRRSPMKTLEFHIIISIAMFLLTHKCPHYLLVI